MNLQAMIAQYMEFRRALGKGLEDSAEQVLR